MSKLFSYSFSLTPARPAEPVEPLHEFSYNEFLLDLPYHWKQVITPEENSFNFHSSSLEAGITISADFFAVPDAKAAAFAEVCLNSRLEQLEKLEPGKVEVLHRTIKPHSGGVGLELAFAAELAGKNIYTYLGYVTSRKVLNFTLVCRPDRQAAAKLFNETMLHYRPKLP